MYSTVLTDFPWAFGGDETPSPDAEGLPEAFAAYVT